MSSQTLKIWTYTLTNGTLTISEDMGLTCVSMLLISGAATVAGTIQAGTVASTALSLSVGSALVISPDTRFILRDITIAATSGVVQFIGTQG